MLQGRGKAKSPSSLYETRDEKQALEYYHMLKAGKGLDTEAGQEEGGGQDMQGSVLCRAN